MKNGPYTENDIPNFCRIMIVKLKSETVLLNSNVVTILRTIIGLVLKICLEEILFYKNRFRKRTFNVVDDCLDHQHC